MAKAKSSKKKSETEQAPSFEESLEELQQIVADLEDGSLGLQEAMQRFETGITLLRGCYEILGQAEQKIEVLTGLDAEGKPIVTEFDGSATIEQSGKKAGRRKAQNAQRDEESSDDDNGNDDEGETLF